MRRDEFPIVEEYCKDKIKAELEEIKAEINKLWFTGYADKPKLDREEVINILDKHIKEIDNE